MNQDELLRLFSRRVLLGLGRQGVLLTSSAETELLNVLRRGADVGGQRRMARSEAENASEQLLNRLRMVLPRSEAPDPPGGTAPRRVSLADFRRALSGICPLYPFC